MFGKHKDDHISSAGTEQTEEEWTSKVCKKCAQTETREGINILLQLFNIGFVTEEDTRRLLMANAMRDGLHRECADALIDQIIKKYKS